MRLISNSEVQDWLKCRRMYYYSFYRDLEPIVQSAPLAMGTLFHAILEQYYIGKASGLSEEECRDMALQPLMVEVRKPGADVAEMGRIRDLMRMYFDHYQSDDEMYRPVGIESELSLLMDPPSDTTEGFSLVGKLDLLWEAQDGGIWVVDHKSSYNFWTDAQVSITGQFMKYFNLAREAGLPVKGVIVNQIRTRPLKNPTVDMLFKRSYTTPSDHRINAAMRQHYVAGLEIMAYRKLPITEKLLQSPPLLDKYACGDCRFLPLCDSQTDGAPVQAMIETDYRLREGYGYNKNRMTKDEQLF